MVLLDDCVGNYKAMVVGLSVEVVTRALTASGKVTARMRLNLSVRRRSLSHIPYCMDSDEQVLLDKDMIGHVGK